MSNDKIELKENKHGKAVFAKTLIKRDEMVASFDGKVYNDENEDEWTEDVRNHAVQFDVMQWRESNSLARFINHSCDPNCGVRGMFDIVAMRDIQPGEELTWHYNMTEDNIDPENGEMWWSMKCTCGSPECLGTITSYRDLPLPVKLKFMLYTSRWLLRKYGIPGTLSDFDRIEKERIRKIFMEEVYMASGAKVFGVSKDSYHFKNLEIAFENFYTRLNGW